MKKIIITFLLIIIILITGCNQQNLDDYVKQPYNYSIYTSEDFFIKYPEWPEAEKGDAEIATSRGYCTVIINTMENTDANGLYNVMIDSTKTAPHVLSYEEDSNNLVIKSVATFQEHKLVSLMKLVGCNNNAHIVNIACVEEVVGYPEVLTLYKDIQDSISCEETIKTSNKETKEEILNNKQEEETIYEIFEQEDFTIESPEWGEINDLSDDTIFSSTKGSVSILVNKHNALPEDLYNWITENIENNEGHKLLLAKEVNEGEYEYKYTFPYEEHTLIAESKIFYCNYESYAPVVVYIESMYDKDVEEVKNKVLNSAVCKKTYPIPKPEIPEEIIEQQPEIIEETKGIVKTDIGEEYGLDAEAIVYFINTNQFFIKIMKDFPNANLVLEDATKNIELKIDIDNDGKITSVEDGLHNNYDVTLYVPLRDALNILNNAANINPITLLKFAVSVRTDPIEVKQEVIDKVLKGEYK
jgi:uncharacterized lipoprotein NlpE involved in copper resistance